MILATTECERARKSACKSACESDWELARAKVNLTLRIIGRRADGYHMISSLVAFADFGDRLRLTAPPAEAAGISLGLSGGEAEALGQTAHQDNLVTRAARLILAMAAEQGRPIPPALVLELEKNLPLASGIGGGSADAAAAMRLLDRHFGWGFGLLELSRRAAILGADVPACVLSQNLLMEGIGERLMPLELPAGLGILLVNPRCALPTAAVFAEFARDRRDYSQALALPPNLSELSELSELSQPSRFFDYLRRGGNELTAAACRLVPAIAESLALLAALPGVEYSAMSGSGASCFALFRARELAAAAALHLRQLHPEWWLSFGSLRQAPE